MKYVPYSEPRNIRRQRTKFSRLGDMAPGICATLLYKLIFLLWLEVQQATLPHCWFV